MLCPECSEHSNRKALVMFVSNATAFFFSLASSSRAILQPFAFDAELAADPCLILAFLESCFCAVATARPPNACVSPSARYFRFCSLLHARTHMHVFALVFTLLLLAPLWSCLH
jgi:hypothetical protein